MKETNSLKAIEEIEKSFNGFYVDDVAEILKYLEQTNEKDIFLPDSMKDIDELEDLTDLVDWINEFYQKGFCDNCGNIYGCNYCPAYSFHENYGYHEKLWNIENEREEFEELHKTCHDICDKCIHKVYVDSEYDYEIQLCHCQFETDSSGLGKCTEKEIENKNQLTIFNTEA